MAKVILISNLLGNDVRSRINAKEVENEVVTAEESDIMIDFINVTFVSRSFTDEIVSIIERNNRKNINIVNTKGIVDDMFSVVKLGRKKTCEQKHKLETITKLDSMESLTAFMTSMA